MTQDKVLKTIALINLTDHFHSFIIKNNSKIMADFDTPVPSENAELQEFLMVEKQKAQVNAQVSMLACYR